MAEPVICRTGGWSLMNQGISLQLLIEELILSRYLEFVVNARNFHFPLKSESSKNWETLISFIPEIFLIFL